MVVERGWFHSDFGVAWRGKIGSLSHSLFTRLIPAYGIGVEQLSVQPNRCSFVQSRA